MINKNIKELLLDIKTLIDNKEKYQQTVNSYRCLNSIRYSNFFHICDKFLSTSYQ